MAYAALASLSELLRHISCHHYYVPRNNEQQLLNSLHEKVTYLQAFLDEYVHKAEVKIEYLEAEIRDVMYQAQDFIERNIYVKIGSSFEGYGEKKGFFRSFFSFDIKKRKFLAVQNKYYKAALVLVLNRIDVVVEEAMNIQMICRDEDTKTAHAPPPVTQNQAANSRNEMVGYEEDMIRIKERICGESSQLGVIPIVGMGGIGKTTFSRNIFNDSLTTYHFHTRAWATISQQYHLRGLLLSILHSATLKTEELAEQIRRSYSRETDDDKLIEEVYKYLKGKRYLIVLDDMWSNDAWDELKIIFPDDNNGSRIVITTRLTNVAEYAASSSSSPFHQMHFLNDDESWDLLREKVFCPPELEEIGKTIAKNCGGLPLAIVVIAGVLATISKNQYQWTTIAENVRATVAAADGNFSKILRLSYDHLPNHLRACFLYMGGFSEDYQIAVSDLIKLWVAEGFVRPMVSKTSEEAAEECLNDLVRRNLVLMTKKTWADRSKICGIHDLLRDLCIQKAEEEEFLDVAGSSTRNLANSRRLAISSTMEVGVTNQGEVIIRSLLQFSLSRELSPLLLLLNLVRILHLPNIWLKSFPEEITEMFNLRYLAFTHNSMTGEPLIFPPTTSKLFNLQTLIVYRLEKDPLLPLLYTLFDIWKFPQLRHLILSGIKIVILPSRRALLQDLQTVSTLINFEFTSEAIAMIPNVRKLKAMYDSREWSEFCLHNLVHLNQLESLKLDLFQTGIVNIIYYADASSVSVPYPVNYCLPASLKELCLRGCRAPMEDMSIIGSLPNLEVLKLKAFYFLDRRWEMKEGEFQKLRFLRIEFSDLMQWSLESTHLPRLEHVIIKCCYILEEVPLEIGDIATLKMIEVRACSQSIADSAILIQEEQERIGNELLVKISSELD